MVKEYIAAVRQLSQSGGDLNKFYDGLDKVIKFEHDQATIDKIYDTSKAATEKLAAAQS